MLRNVSKLQQPLQGAVSAICKQYGTRALAQVEMTDVATARTVTEMNPLKTPVKQKHETNVVYTRKTCNKLHFNLEDLTKDLQMVFAKKLLERMEELIKENKTRSISFNFINEDVFRYHLNMQIRKLGFDSYFQRYTDDKGLAVFSLRTGRVIKMDNSNTGSYNRMAYIKQYQSLLVDDSVV